MRVIRRGFSAIPVTLSPATDKRRERQIVQSSWKLDDFLPRLTPSGRHLMNMCSGQPQQSDAGMQKTHRPSSYRAASCGRFRVVPEEGSRQLLNRLLERWNEAALGQLVGGFDVPGSGSRAHGLKTILVRLVAWHASRSWAKVKVNAVAPTGLATSNGAAPRARTRGLPQPCLTALHRVQHVQQVGTRLGHGAARHAPVVRRREPFVGGFWAKQVAERRTGDLSWPFQSVAASIVADPPGPTSSTSARVPVQSGREVSRTQTRPAPPGGPPPGYRSATEKSTSPPTARPTSRYWSPGAGGEGDASTANTGFR